MELKFDIKIKTEPLMQAFTVSVAIISLAGIIISSTLYDRATTGAAIAAITALALVIRPQ
jgi:uncharacterized phage infection (PIP) family protein YhgE